MESLEVTNMFDVVLNDHSSVFSSSLYCLQQDGFMCDTKLSGTDGHVLVHGVVLSVASLYLKETIEKAPQDAKNFKLINLENENISVINLFIKLLYTGTVICSKQNVEKIVKLIKLFKIENVFYNIDKKESKVNISDDNGSLKSVSKSESSVGDITLIENRETVTEPNCEILTHLNKSTNDNSDLVADKARRDSPAETSADDRNSSPGSVRKVSTRKRKLNPKYFDVSPETPVKENIHTKRQLKSSVTESSEKSAPLVGRKSRTTITDINSAEEVKTRTGGQRSSKGYNEATQKEKAVDERKLFPNDLKNEPSKNNNHVKQKQDIKTKQAKQRKVETTVENDEVKVHTINRDAECENTICDEQIQTESALKKSDVEKVKIENECTYDKKQESKENEQSNNAQDLLEKLGLISTKDCIVEERKNSIECETGLSDTQCENNRRSKRVTQSRNEPRKCRKCGKMSENYEEYLKHRQEKHPDFVAKLASKNQKLRGRQRKYCKSCDLTFDCYKSFLQHRKEVKHVRKNHVIIYNCDYCEYTTKVECYLDMHKIKKHNMDISETRYEIFRCPAEGCVYFNLRKSILDTHVAEVHDTMNAVVCEICGKTMKTSKQLKQHVKMHVPVDQREKRFECPECDKKFTRRMDFTLHFKHKHKNEKPFMCHLCPYRVTTQRLLDIHLYSLHQLPLPSYIKQHTCPVCGYITIYKHYLEQHLNRHKGEAKFQCHLCEKSFLAKPNLTAHLWRHNTENKKCPYEDCRYQGKGQRFKEHIKLMHTHKDEKPYQCPLCNYMGKSRCRVRNHLLKFHKMKKVQQEIAYIPDQQAIEINNLENTEAVRQITHVTANGNIELDTVDLNNKSVDLVMKGLYKQGNISKSENSEFYLTQSKLESADQATRVIVKEEPTSGENVTHMIVDNDGILTAIQDSKNVIILQHDGLQYGAIEVVDSQI